MISDEETKRLESLNILLNLSNLRPAKLSLSLFEEICLFACRGVLLPVLEISTGGS
ncbi:hypothetical protein HJC23_006588 [Cyclotella cryptica]|uniref:Uncharacterized protein n=1 Tax=Cyclotella cryptica TaxID=29204 RepID=A0ABD3PE18_9STRA